MVEDVQLRYASSGFNWAARVNCVVWRYAFDMDLSELPKGEGYFQQEDTVLTESPKCLLTLPPKGWKPESRILPDRGLFAEEPLYFRSGIRRLTVLWVDFNLFSLFPCCTDIEFRIKKILSAVANSQGGRRREGVLLYFQ